MCHAIRAGEFGLLGLGAAAAAVGAKEALFSQQQTARSKVRLARQKKHSVATKVNANNARLAEVARVVMPGLKPTPPAPPPKKFLGLF